MSGRPCQIPFCARHLPLGVILYLTEKLEIGSSIAMLRKTRKLQIVAVASVACLPLAQSASALTAETVRNCRLMAREAFPTTKSDGKTSEAAKAQNRYFRDCIDMNVKNENKSQSGTSSRSRNGTAVRKPKASGTGVPTGQGPLSQPVPPAVSTTNPQQNSSGRILHPQNMPGPAQTNPPQEPFGSK